MVAARARKTGPGGRCGSPGASSRGSWNIRVARGVWIRMPGARRRPAAAIWRRRTMRAIAAIGGQPRCVPGRTRGRARHARAALGALPVAALGVDPAPSPPASRALVRLTADRCSAATSAPGSWMARPGPPRERRTRRRRRAAADGRPQRDSRYCVAVELPTGARQDHILYAQPTWVGRPAHGQPRRAAPDAVASSACALTAVDPYTTTVFIVAERPEGIVPDIRAVATTPAVSMPRVADGRARGPAAARRGVGRHRPPGLAGRRPRAPAPRAARRPAHVGRRRRPPGHRGRLDGHRRRWAALPDGPPAVPARLDHRCARRPTSSRSLGTLPAGRPPVPALAGDARAGQRRWQERRPSSSPPRQPSGRDR